MDKQALGRTDELVSAASLGCMLFGSHVDVDRSYAILDRYVERGGSFLDTADCYAWWVGEGFVGDESETLLGEWMRTRGNRDELFVATKVGARPLDPAAVRGGRARLEDQLEGLAPATIRQAVTDSLSRLGTDRIDLLYAHIDDRTVPLADTLGAFGELVEQGLVRHLGCSNIGADRLAEALRISETAASYQAVQQQFSVLEPVADADFGVGEHADAAMLSLCRQQRLTLLAYSPLLKNLYRDDYENSPLWPQFATDSNRRRLEILTRAATDMGVTRQQAVFAWLAPRCIPLIAASSIAQLDANLDGINLRLPEEIENELTAVS